MRSHKLVQFDRANFGQFSDLRFNLEIFVFFEVIFASSISSEIPTRGSILGRRRIIISILVRTHRIRDKFGSIQARTTRIRDRFASNFRVNPPYSPLTRKYS